MRPTLPLALLSLAPLEAACTCQEAPAPVVFAVRPAEAPNDADTPLAILGANFLPLVSADMNDPARSQVSAAFALDLLGAGGGRVALAGATLVSEGEIRATLLAGSPPGTYDLSLTDPRGRTAYLPGALLVVVRSCALAPDGTPCDDGNLCTQVDTCQGGICIGSSPVVCAATDPCQPGACDPGTGQLLAWLLVTGCNGIAVLLAPGSAGSQVTQCQIEAPPSALMTSVGLSAQDSGTIGPRNLVTGWTAGVGISAAGGLVDGNTIRANGAGIAIGGVPAGATVTVQRNQVYANAVAGMAVGSSSGSLLVRHNLFHGNGSDGFDAGAATLVVHNNLFTDNGHYGVNAPPGDFAPGAFDYNGFFGNPKGNTIIPLATGPHDVLADPLYVNPAAFDFRLAPNSPDVNAGIDTGLDVNGPAPGLYNGSAPDLGPEETPYTR